MKFHDFSIPGIFFCIFQGFPWYFQSVGTLWKWIHVMILSYIDEMLFPCLLEHRLIADLVRSGSYIYQATMLIFTSIWHIILLNRNAKRKLIWISFLNCYAKRSDLNSDCKLGSGGKPLWTRTLGENMQSYFQKVLNRCLHYSVMILHVSSQSGHQICDIHYECFKPNRCKYSILRDIEAMIYMTKKLSHKSHNVPVPYPTIHHFWTETCTFLLQNGVLWDMGQVNGGRICEFVYPCRRPRSGNMWPWNKYRADSRLAPSQWEMSLQSNAISHWLGANLESALKYKQAIHHDQPSVHWNFPNEGHPRLVGV